jgi:oxaloacetate decarboxylase gamma subunit
VVSLETSLLDQGITLMLVGMGTVFTFLTILVIGMSLMSAIVMRLTPDPDACEVNEEEIAVITAAIARHRSKTAK